MMPMKQTVLRFPTTAALAIQPISDVARDRVDAVLTPAGLPRFVVVLAADPSFMKVVAPKSSGMDPKKDST